MGRNDRDCDTAAGVEVACDGHGTWVYRIDQIIKDAVYDRFMKNPLIPEGPQIKF